MAYESGAIAYLNGQWSEAEAAFNRAAEKSEEKYFTGEAKIAHAMSYFDGALANIGGADMRSSVTTFTASDFSRTFNTNGDGTDHAWGGHHFVMGGAVRGKDIYGQFPTVGVDLGTFRNPDMVSNSLVPTTSVDQYGATLAR